MFNKQFNQNRQEDGMERQYPIVVPGAPFAPPVVGAPFGAAPMLPAAYPNFPAGAPTTVAPVRRVVHPTRYFETHTVTRYPIVHVFPTHTRRVHHNVYEHYCEYPHSASEQCCDHKVDCCCPPVQKPTC